MQALRRKETESHSIQTRQVVHRHRGSLSQVTGLVMIYAGTGCVTYDTATVPAKIHRRIPS
jgi:hypothetical protein